MKETFIIRTEWSDAIFDLSSEDKATVFDNLFNYHLGNENLINLNNLTVKLVWKLIQPNLIRNIDQYDKRRETSLENGKKGGRPRKESILEENNLNNLNKNLNNLTEPNETLSVSVLDSVIVLDSENDFKKKSDSKFSKNENSSQSQKEIELALELEKANEIIKSLEEKEKKEKSSAKKEKTETEYPFDVIWEVYGKKGSRKISEKKYDLVKESDRAIIFEHVPRYVLSTPEIQFRKDFSTYLNQESFRDEIINRGVQSYQNGSQSQTPPRFNPNFKGLESESKDDKYKIAKEAVKQKMRDSITAKMYATN